MHIVIMFAGLFLGMRYIWGDRQFNELPTFHYRIGTSIFGIGSFLLTSLTFPLIKTTLSALDVIGSAIFSWQVLVISVLLFGLVYLCFQFGLEFAKSYRMLVEREMARRVRKRK